MTSSKRKRQSKRQQKRQRLKDVEDAEDAYHTLVHSSILTVIVCVIIHTLFISKNTRGDSVHRERKNLENYYNYKNVVLKCEESYYHIISTLFTKCASILMGKPAKTVASIFILARVIAKSGFQEENENRSKTLADSR
jgi:hypothetical protein